LKDATLAGPPVKQTATYLLDLIRRRPDMTLLEIQERVIANLGERFASSVLLSFFDRHQITFGKPRTMRSSGVPTY
jgi:hypothetical protein